MKNILTFLVLKTAISLLLNTMDTSDQAARVVCFLREKIWPTCPNSAWKDYIDANIISCVWSACMAKYYAHLGLFRPNWYSFYWIQCSIGTSINKHCLDCFAIWIMSKFISVVAHRILLQKPVPSSLANINDYSSPCDWSPLLVNGLDVQPWKHSGWV